MLFRRLAAGYGGWLSSTPAGATICLGRAVAGQGWRASAGRLRRFYSGTGLETEMVTTSAAEVAATTSSWPVITVGESSQESQQQGMASEVPPEEAERICPLPEGSALEAFEALMDWTVSQGVFRFKVISRKAQVSRKDFETCQYLTELTCDLLFAKHWYNPQLHSLPFISKQVLYIPLFHIQREKTRTFPNLALMTLTAQQLPEYTKLLGQMFEAGKTELAKKLFEKLISAFPWLPATVYCAMIECIEKYPSAISTDLAFMISTKVCSKACPIPLPRDARMSLIRTLAAQKYPKPFFTLIQQLKATAQDFELEPPILELMVQGACKQRDLDQALEYFEQLKKTDHVISSSTLNHLLSTLIYQSRDAEVHQMCAQLQSRNLFDQISLHSMVTFYLQKEQPNEALMMIKNHPHLAPTSASLARIVEHLCAPDAAPEDIDTAFLFLTKLMDRSVEPSVFLLDKFLRTAMGSRNYSSARAWQLLRFSEQSRAITAQSVVRMKLRTMCHGSSTKPLETIHGLFDSLEAPHSSDYYVLISCYLARGELKGAFKLLGEAHRKLGRSLSSVVYVPFFRCPSMSVHQSTQLLKSLRIHKMMPHQGTFSGLIDTYCRAQNWERTLHVLAVLERNDMPITMEMYLPLVQHCKLISEAVAHLERALAKGIAPNSPILNVLIKRLLFIQRSQQLQAKQQQQHEAGDEGVHDDEEQADDSDDEKETDEDQDLPEQQHDPEAFPRLLSLLTSIAQNHQVLPSHRLHSKLLRTAISNGRADLVEAHLDQLLQTPPLQIPKAVFQPLIHHYRSLPHLSPGQLQRQTIMLLQDPLL